MKLPNSKRRWSAAFQAGVAAACVALGTRVEAAPKTVLISLDGATPRFAEKFLTNGVLNPNQGLGLLKQKGIYARQNLTVSPSLTAPGHIAIATGSTAARNDVPANTFQLLASPFTSTVSGFGAAIGGYDHHGPAEAQHPTAEPIWIALRAAGKKVVAATFPGADGVDVRIPGLAGSPIIQPAAERTVDFTVPFGAFGGIGAQGFSLTASDFTDAPSAVVNQLTAAGKTSFSPVKFKANLETVKLTGVTNVIDVVALDTTNDATVNYDTLVFFGENEGIPAGPFSLPSTGPAYVKEGGANSASFYFEGSTLKVGSRYYATKLASDLSLVRLARTGANFVPRNIPVIGDVDEVNTHVGFWAPQADFRIPERLSPGFNTFPDLELEDIYENLVTTFTDYQLRLVRHAMSKVPDADLVMVYFEQPDGSEHQFLLVDPRQPSDFTNPDSIGAGQDAAKVARYAQYIEKAYQTVNDAVHALIMDVGLDANGRPLANVIVTSDHGFEPFHTAVNLNNLLARNGIPNTKVRAVTSGPAVNLYINLAGRYPTGTVSREEYVPLMQQVAAILQGAADTNATYTLGAASVPLFHRVYTRPVSVEPSSPEFGYETSEFIGQDSGDVFAMLTPGYNFDGTQSPVVVRKGDQSEANLVLSLPNFYGAHGYDPTVPNMSAIFFAAGPNIGSGVLNTVHNIDLAPTIEKIVGVDPAETVEGNPLLLASLGVNARGTLPNGVSAGDITATSVVLWTHSVALGNVTFDLSASPLLVPALSTTVAPVTNTNLPVKVKVENLQPHTDYYYAAIDAAGTRLTGRFRTAARAVDGAKGLRFGISGDWRGDLAPFPSLANASSRNLDFFLKFGDTIYADVASPSVNIPQTHTLAEYRSKHAEVYADRLGANTLADLQAGTAIFSVIDDHEVINDFAGGALASTDSRFDQNGGRINETQLFQNGLQAFTEYNAIEDLRYNTPSSPLTHSKPNLYRSRTFGADAAVFILDSRSFRDAELPEVASLGAADVGAYLARSFDINPANGQPLPPRTMLSGAQFAQLKTDLAAAQTAGVLWKFVCVPEPIQNLGVLAASDRFEGYAAERTALLHYIRTNGIRNVVFVTADIHGTLVNNLTYQFGPGQPQIATDMFEISTGAVAYHAPFGPTVMDLAGTVVVAPGTTLLQQFLAGLGLPNRAAFDALLTRSQKDAALAGLVNAQLNPLGYDTLGLEGSPVPARLEIGAFYSMFTYGWTEFDIDALTQELTVTTYGIDYYSPGQVASEILTRMPAVVQCFTVQPRGAAMEVQLNAQTVGGRLELTWPAAAFHYALQSTISLDGAWTDVTALPEIASNQLRVRVDTTGTKFFRLIRRN